MEPRLTWEKITLKLRNPFRLSYGTSEERQAYWIRLANDEGWGEGTIPPYYHVDQAETEAFGRRLQKTRLRFPDSVSDIGAWVGNEGPAVARCALDLALHDRIGKLTGQPLYKLLGLPTPKTDEKFFYHCRGYSR